MLRPARSATMPLACSMTMRLLSAFWSCSFTTWPSSAARCWRIAMVATSARAWRPRIGRSQVEPALDPEQVQGADGRTPQAHGQRVHRPEAGFERVGL